MSWLWKSDPTSPANFEKALSKLSTQITSANLSLESSRGRSRRIKALLTIYSTVTYLLYTLVITLVLGPQKWSIPHYAGLVGAPVLIYGTRRLITLFFDWQIGRQQVYVEGLQKQREIKINELKRATKFDSTQELLQKYGGAPKQTPSKQPQQGTKRKIATPQDRPQRTGIAPPPTANIPGRNPGVNPATPQRPDLATSPTSARAKNPRSVSGLETSPAAITPEEPGFAPNAFSNTIPPPKSAYDQPSHWYDRILDVLLGDDETLAKNRLALICSNCRLVNGQAPPDVKTLEQVGRWRCSSCQSWNGVENETAKVVREMTEKADNKREESRDKISSGDEAGTTMHKNEAEQAQEKMAKGTPDLEDEASDEIESDHENPDIESDEVDPSTTTKRVTRSAGKH